MRMRIRLLLPLLLIAALASLPGGLASETETTKGAKAEKDEEQQGVFMRISGFIRTLLEEEPEGEAEEGGDPAPAPTLASAQPTEGEEDALPSESILKDGSSKSSMKTTPLVKNSTAPTAKVPTPKEVIPGLQITVRMVLQTTVSVWYEKRTELRTELVKALTDLYGHQVKIAELKQLGEEAMKKWLITDTEKNIAKEENRRENRQIDHHLRVLKEEDATAPAPAPAPKAPAQDAPAPAPGSNPAPAAAKEEGPVDLKATFSILCEGSSCAEEREKVREISKEQLTTTLSNAASIGKSMSLLEKIKVLEVSVPPTEEEEEQEAGGFLRLVVGILIGLSMIATCVYLRVKQNRKGKKRSARRGLQLGHGKQKAWNPVAPADDENDEEDDDNDDDDDDDDVDTFDGDGPMEAPHAPIPGLTPPEPLSFVPPTFNTNSQGRYQSLRNSSVPVGPSPTTRLTGDLRRYASPSHPQPSGLRP